MTGKEHYDCAISRLERLIKCALLYIDMYVVLQHHVFYLVSPSYSVLTYQF